MEEIGIGLVNQQAEEIGAIVYPEWTGQLAWSVVGKAGTDEDGYDLYEIRRGVNTLVIPANRLVFLKALVEKVADGRL